jgi:hypothetical protein
MMKHAEELRKTLIRLGFPEGNIKTLSTALTARFMNFGRVESMLTLTDCFFISAATAAQAAGPVRDTSLRTTMIKPSRRKLDI